MSSCGNDMGVMIVIAIQQKPWLMEGLSLNGPSFYSSDCHTGPVTNFIHFAKSNSGQLPYGWLLKLWSLFGSPRY